MGKTSIELEAEIKSLERLRDEAINREAHQAEIAETQRKQVEERHRKAEEAALERRLAEARERREKEAVEAEEARRRNLEHILSLLPKLQDMPKCRECSHHLTFASVPPEIFEMRRYDRSIPATNLRCPNCGYIYAAEYRNPIFPLSYD